jgi:hypothetical protein
MADAAACLAASSEPTLGGILPIKDSRNARGQPFFSLSGNVARGVLVERQFNFEWPKGELAVSRARTKRAIVYWVRNKGATKRTGLGCERTIGREGDQRRLQTVPRFRPKYRSALADTLL